MVLVVAKKSTTFSSFSYTANESVCRSWEGAQPGSEPKLAKGNIPWMSCPVYAWGLAGGQETSFFQEFNSPFPPIEFELFG